MNGYRAVETFQRGLLAGAFGGLAEIAWIAIYAGVTGGDPAAVARAVVTAAGVNALLPASPTGLGIAVHLILSAALGVGLAFAWLRLREFRRSGTHVFAFAMIALAGVWTINFFAILPIVSPDFVHIVPYAVSLTSKLLFGLAAATALSSRSEKAAPCVDRGCDVDRAVAPGRAG